MVSLTPAVQSPYRVLHRSKEIHHAMTAAATARADLDVARAVPGTARAVPRALAKAALPRTSASDRPLIPRFVADIAGRPVGIPHVHDLPRAGIA